MKRIIIVTVTLLVLTLISSLALTPTPVLADGIIIPEPPICIDCPVPPPPPHEVPYLTVEYHRVNVTIDNQVATTRIDQVFRNDSPWSLEGTYIFPLPEDAAISEFAMWVNGEKVTGQLYTKEEARRIYDDIVRRRLDPALLEYVGRDLFQASIFPIDPGDTRRIEIEYAELLPVDNGLVRYVYPLSTERFSGKPLENVAVTVDLTSRDPIKAIYSPSHPASIDRDGRYRALIGWEDYDVLPTTDFSLYYTISSEDVGVNLLSLKERDEDGFFVLLVAPNVDAEQVVEKDVILVLDTSGSMEGEKMEQARDALKYVLDHLNQGDRLNIIAFSTGLRAFSNRTEPLSAVPEARRFVDSLRAEGSTDINRALLEAITSADQQRPTIIIFLTDGLPTSGVVETPLILNNVDQAASSNLRVFPFGVGDDVDTVLLDTLAQEQRGASAYVRPGERVDEQVSAFYAKVSTPVLADIQLDVDGVRIEDNYPYPLPDLFAGTQLIIAGRYREGGPATISLTGEVNGRSRSFTFDDLYFATDRQHSQSADFIPRLWATRKVGHLLNQIRLHGENRETIDEIVNLSIRYGIITPYTSFLVEEPEMALSHEGRDAIVEQEVAAAEEAPAPEVSGSTAVEKAVEQNRLAGADMAAPLPTATPGIGDGGEAGTAMAAVTAVGDKAFVLKNGVWTDTVFDPTRMTATPLPFPSNQFSEFLHAHPETGKYFALGSRVIVVVGGTAYETVAGDPDEYVAPAASPPENVPAGSTQPEPTGGPVTSLPPANAGEVYTTLTVDVAEGVAPLEVNFTGELVGGRDDNPDYYCVETSIDFGDGISQSSTPSCIEWQEGMEIKRRYTANYVYEEPGEYQVTFSLGGTESEPVTIIVRDEASASETPSAQTDPAALSGDSDEPAGRPGGLGCLGGLLPLSLIGLVIGWRPKRRP
ncbi:MAG: VWA domain-containing protein [Anaerolineae bacterium]|nr:VWA domain-containing protein [Anaerolineae bacterium]